MIIRAHAKINWDLYIPSRLENGYHELNSLMQPVALADELSLDAAAEDMLTVSGPYAAGVPTDGSNLALRAAQRYREAAGITMSLHIHIEKHIPHGAGLGGGSADAAAVLNGMNRMSTNPLPPAALADLALSLGADVPFCLQGHACIARGIGERLTAHPLPEGIPLLILMGGEGLNTAQVYRTFDALALPYDPALAALTRSALRRGDLAGFSPAQNMLYPAARTLLSSLEEGLEALTASGAAFAAMTGSGAALFGAYRDERTAKNALNLLQSRYPVCLYTRTGDGAVQPRQ